MTDVTPRVSILIPNYNNGIASSNDGQTDLLGDLLRSLFDTLDSDPTPLEVIAYDDGSTDDSLATLRDFAGRTWRGGQAFLTLIEARHCGVLSKAANALVAASRGDILVRLDGDTQMLTAHWVSKLVRVFDEGPPRLGVVGPKQLTPSGLIQAFGDWVLHPRGYHHIAGGMLPDAVTRAMECDHVMGCFYCCRRAVHDELGGYDENFLRGQTIDFGLRARLAGWSCIAVPHIEFVHRHGQRVNRATRADQAEGVRHTLQVFRDKWGFDRIAPDLEEVRRRYAGTPLLWNAAVFGVGFDALDEAPLRTEPITIEQTGWSRYANDQAYRGMVDMRLQATAHVIEQVGRPKRVVLIGGGSRGDPALRRASEAGVGGMGGVLAHLLASRGLNVAAVDRDADAVAFARTCVKNQSYPNGVPTFVASSHPRRLPLEDGACDMALVYDVLEHDANPVGLLNEVARVLSPGGVLVALASRPTQMNGRGYRLRELAQQVLHAGEGVCVAGGSVSDCKPGPRWSLLINPDKEDVKQPVVVVVARREGSQAGAKPREEVATRAA